MKHDLKVDDLARVVQSGGRLGETLFVLTYVDKDRPWLVQIREAGNPRASDQWFDASLLKKVPR